MNDSERNEANRRLIEQNKKSAQDREKANVEKFEDYQNEQIKKGANSGNKGCLIALSFLGGAGIANVIAFQKIAQLLG